MSYQIVAISNEKGPEEQALNKLERAGASAGEILVHMSSISVGSLFVQWKDSFLYFSTTFCEIF